MRVAIFAETYYPFISGVVTHIDSLKQGLEQAGHKVLIVTLDPKARHHYVKDNVLYCPAVPLKRIYGYGVANPVNVRRYRIVHTFNPDIIHLHTEFSMGIFALFSANRLKKPVVYTLHTMYDDYVFYLFPEKMNKVAKPVAHSYIRNVASKATEIIGPSIKVADYLKKCGVNRYINIVPNTVDLSDFMPENVDKKEVEKARAELGLQPGDVGIMFVGRLGKEKSIDVLIDYFSQNFKNDILYKLFVIGDGPDKHLLEDQIHQSDMKNQIRLLGRIEHEKIPYYYHACDLYATASLTEMNSMALLEATASGLYAVHRLDVYNRDQIKSGKNGDVFRNAEEFAEIIRAYGALDEAGRKKRKTDVTNYARQYGLPEFTESILNVYERAIARHVSDK